MNDLRLQLIGTLNVNSTVTEVNNKLKEVEKKINKLNIDIKFDDTVTTKINDLYDKMKSISKVTVDTQMFSSLQKEIDELRKHNEQLQESLEGTLDPKKKKKAKIFGGLKDEVIDNLRTLEQLENYLKTMGMKYTVDFKINKDGIQEVKKVVTQVKNEFGELEKITIVPKVTKKNGTHFKQVAESITTDDVKAVDDYEKAYSKLDEKFKQIERSGKAQYETIERAQRALDSFSKNVDLPITHKINELNKAYKELDVSFKNDSHAYSMAKSMEQMADKVDNLRVSLEKTKNSYKGTIDTLKANQLANEIDILSKNMPKFDNQADVDRYDNQIKAMSNSIANLGAEATKARASSLGLFGSLSVAMQRFPVWINC